MNISSKAEIILDQIHAKTKLGDLRKMAKDIKRDHELAMELWSNGKFLPRQLAILIMDNKLLSQDLINKLVKNMQDHPLHERNQLMDWLMANQLSKDKGIYNADGIVGRQPFFTSKTNFLVLPGSFALAGTNTSSKY